LHGSHPLSPVSRLQMSQPGKSLLPSDCFQPTALEIPGLLTLPRFDFLHYVCVCVCVCVCVQQDLLITYWALRPSAYPSVTQSVDIDGALHVCVIWPGRRRAQDFVCDVFVSFAAATSLDAALTDNSFLHRHIVNLNLSLIIITRFSRFLDSVSSLAVWCIMGCRETQRLY